VPGGTFAFERQWSRAGCDDFVELWDAGYDFVSHYSASKIGVIGLTQSLTVESGRFGMTVNSVCPGTTMGQSSMPQKDAMRGMGTEEIIRVDSESLAVRRLGTPADVADTVLFLIIDNAGWIAGQAISVDTGALLAGSHGTKAWSIGDGTGFPEYSN
jgi:NAD(P)-dependent dehydrogenase (short-subunit alcohol dehydrogenase family)